MQFKSRSILLSPILGVFMLLSCNHQGEIFVMPEGVEIKSEHLFDLLHIDRVLGNPNRARSIWNTELVKRCGIKQISVSADHSASVNVKNEKSVYLMNEEGNPKEYLHYYDLNKPEEDSKSHYFYSAQNEIDSIAVEKFLGIPSKNGLGVKRKGSQCQYVYHKGGAKKDEISYVTISEKAQLILRKSGDVLVGIEFIVPEGTAMSKLKQMLQNQFHKMPSLEFTDMNVTYLKAGIPQKTFAINLDWAQVDLQKEWIYNEDGLLSEFKEWGNRNLVKDITFEYWPDHLPRALIFNGVDYIFDYQ